MNPAFHTETHRVARKRHTCTECRGYIEPGDRYEFVSGLWDGDVSQQVEWYGRKLTDEDWKHIFSAAVQKQDAVPGIDGGFVVLGVSTRKQSQKWFSDLFEVMHAFGAEHGVRWTEPDRWGGQY